MKTVQSNIRAKGDFKLVSDDVHHGRVLQDILLNHHIPRRAHFCAAAKGCKALVGDLRHNHIKWNTRQVEPVNSWIFLCHRQRIISGQLQDAGWCQSDQALIINLENIV